VYKTKSYLSGHRPRYFRVIVCVLAREDFRSSCTSVESTVFTVFTSVPMGRLETNNHRHSLSRPLVRISPASRHLKIFKEILMLIPHCGTCH
jgi:hypothetical protein